MPIKINHSSGKIEVNSLDTPHFLYPSIREDKDEEDKEESKAGSMFLDDCPATYSKK